MLIDIPAYVQEAPYVRNSVEVRAGTNWDLSRTAVETPIARLPDPVPLPGNSLQSTQHRAYLAEHGVASDPAAEVLFAKNSALLTGTGQRQLKKLPKSPGMVIVGHSDSLEIKPEKLAESRAQAVSRYLQKNGYKELKVISLSNTQPATLDRKAAEKNRRVEIFRR